MSDTLNWLKEQTLYPKIMIGEQAAAGCAQVYSKAPAPSDERIWGGMEFDGPWKAFWLPQIDLIDGCEVKHSGLAKFPALPVMDRGENITQTEWISQIEQCLSRIEAGELSKIVMARKVQIDPVVPKKLNFWFQPNPDVTFMGNTPEQLFWREGKTLFSEALAGTHTDETALLASEKDRREFEWVRSDILAKLKPFCTSVESGPVGTKRAGKICHLHSSIKGNLKSDVTDGDILELLHPTPAMGGVPWKNARKVISELENFNRGLYAAPLGFYSKSCANFIVCIRSALLIKNKMHLFSGTGIVKGSDPKMEWDELNRKVELWTQVS